MDGYYYGYHSADGEITRWLSTHQTPAAVPMHVRGGGGGIGQGPDITVHITPTL